MKKLIIENSPIVETIVEQTESGKQLYIEGIFAQAEVVNGNKRFYPRAVLEKAVENYQRDFIDRRVALGELNHPARPDVDPAEGAILIESLTWQGNNVVGRAKVLNTPKGQIIRGLLEGGYNMGVSTRGLGDVSEKNGLSEVTAFQLTAIDAVSNPSGPDCYVNPIMESVDGVWRPVEEQSKQPEDIDEDKLLKSFSDIFEYQFNKIKKQVKGS